MGSNVKRQRIQSDLVLEFIQYPERQLPVPDELVDNWGPCEPSITKALQDKIHETHPDLRKCRMADLNFFLGALGVPDSMIGELGRYDKIVVLSKVGDVGAHERVFARFGRKTKERRDAIDEIEKAEKQAKKDEERRRENEIFERGRRAGKMERLGSMFTPFHSDME